MSVREIDLKVAGPGIVFCSPPAVEHIPRGADYLQVHFAKPSDVARHVMDCRLTAFCTGSPGSFRVRFLEGPPDEATVEAAAFKLRLGLLVEESKLCVRDLYDLMDWYMECRPDQQLFIADGWYRLTVYSSPPPSGILGDGQIIDIVMEKVSQKPALRWEGVPFLCDAG